MWRGAANVRSPSGAAFSERNQGSTDGHDARRNQSRERHNAKHCDDSPFGFMRPNRFRHEPQGEDADGELGDIQYWK
jgi:hypothetical protein